MMDALVHDGSSLVRVVVHGGDENAPGLVRPDVGHIPKER
jgi:hypothetical protein